MKDQGKYSFHYLNVRRLGGHPGSQ